MDGQTLHKLDDENENEYIYRVCKMKEEIGTWQDVCELLNSALGVKYTESKYRKDYAQFMKVTQINEKNMTSNDKYLDSVRQERRSLEKERKKIQTEKLEYNKWLREEARDELIRDAIIEEIRNCGPFTTPRPIYPEESEKSVILAFGDEHFGTEFQIYGLHGEILNEYSPEIFEKRMWNLFYKLVDIIKKEDIEILHVFSLGDCIDGIIRVSQLMKLKYGVVEASIKYAMFMSHWLNELSKYVYIKYQVTYGNHSELRLLSQPKGTFKYDNTGLFVKEIIKTRLENNQNFEITENPTGLIFDNISGFNVLCIHGECKDLAKAIKDFSHTYNTNIDVLIGGHMHHYKGENVGIGKEVISVPSIIGIDDFSMKLNRTSNPGASLIFLEEDVGETLEYKIKL